MSGGPGQVDVLVHVEDPGAANYIAGLEQALAAAGVTVQVLAEGAAATYLPSAGSESDVAGPWEAADLLAGRSPRVVMVGTSENPDSRGLSLLRAARRASIATIGIVDARSNAEHRFRGRSDDPLANAPDWIVVPDSATATAYSTLGFPSQRIRQSLNPQFAAAREVGRLTTPQQREHLRRDLFPDAVPDHTVLVFAAEISTGLDPAQYLRTQDYSLVGRGGSVRRTDIVIEEVLDAIAALPSPRPYLVLRLHPKNDIAEFAAYADEFHRVSQHESALDVICAADAVVGMTSTLLLEAVAMGRPTLAVVPREVERSWLPDAHSGGPPVVTDRPELRRAMTTLLSDPLGSSPSPADTNQPPPDGLLQLVVELVGERR